MTIRSFYYLIVIFITISCSTSTRESDAESGNLSPEQQKVSDLEEQVIEVHDEVMPRMGTLVSLKEQLESENIKLESSEQAGAQDQVIVNSLVMENLDTAHESMMDWMRNFQGVDLGGDPNANLEYLQEELDNINMIKQQVEDAIAAAEETLGD